MYYLDHLQSGSANKHVLNMSIYGSHYTHYGSQPFNYNKNVEISFWTTNLIHTNIMQTTWHVHCMTA